MWTKKINIQISSSRGPFDYKKYVTNGFALMRVLLNRELKSKVRKGRKQNFLRDSHS